jgi:uncharacterized protein YjbI with pentapeptide repeats
MKRSISISKILFHPSTRAILSGLIGAFIGFLINLVSGGQTTQMVWIALTFAILFSLSLSAWQVYNQEKSGQQMASLIQEMAFQSYFLTVLTDKPEISRMTQQRISQVLKNLNGEQQVSMLKFFSEHGFPAPFVGDALRGNKALIGADLHKIVLPQIDISHANLSRVNFSGADLTEAQLHDTLMQRANLSGANLSHANIHDAVLIGADLQGTNFTGANLRDSVMGVVKKEKRPTLSSQAKIPLLRDQPANMKNVILAHANLRGAVFMGVNLTGADFQGADLTSGILSQADLTGANLQGADLTNAILIDAILDGADLRNAEVTDLQLSTIHSGKNMKREA